MYTSTDPAQLTISASSGYGWLPFALLIGIGIALASGGVVYALRRIVARLSAADEDKETTFAQAAIASLVVGTLGLFLGLAFIPSPEQVAQQSQMSWVADKYGIQLDRTQLKELDFPESVPTEDQSFGITQVNIGKSIVTVQLYWEDNKFGLLGTDGEPLKPLPRAE